MSIDNTKAASRPAAVAELLLERKIDASQVYSKWVVLTGDAGSLRSLNGRWCLLDALRLLSCVVGNLAVVLPEGADELTREVEALVAKTWARGERRIWVGQQPAQLASAAAILNVGPNVLRGYPWTSIGAQGWVAGVSSGTAGVRASFSQPNPMAALMAASLGVAEVFKRLIGVPADVAPLLSAEISLFDYAIVPESVGPLLPAHIQFPSTLLTGAGALSNGIALLLSQLPVTGRVRIVDKQNYGDENFGTCLLLERDSWLGQPKAERMAAWLAANSGLTVSGERATIDVAIASGSLAGVGVDLVLNGLDDVQARRDTQRLWPAVLIDGAINAVGAAVIQHRLSRPDLGCLLCWFEAPKVDEKQQQSRVSGLDVRSLSELGRQLSDDDILLAAPDKREWLEECRRRHKTVCSTIADAEMKARLGVLAEDSFRPSAPFVATASAAMVVAEAVKALRFPSAPVTSQFQLGNLFLGPESSAFVRRPPTADCRCIVHRRVLQRLRWRAPALAATG